MLTRRHQFTVLLILSAGFLLLFSASRLGVVGRAYMHAQYAPWTNPPPVAAEAVLTLQNTRITETTLPGIVPVTGFTIFDRLYVKNGTLFVVSSKPTAFPEKNRILARPLDTGHGHPLDPTPQVCYLSSIGPLSMLRN